MKKIELSSLTIIYKYSSPLETPTYWMYHDEFPPGWIWISNESKGNEEFEYFEGPKSSESEMLTYLELKFLLFQKNGMIRYFKFLR